MLEVKEMTFGYGKKKHNVFNGLSLALESGAVYGLLGKNGSGKSTLLYLMCGMLRARQGSVLYKGMDVSHRQPSVLNEMFLVPEEFILPPVALRKYVELNAPFYPRFSQETLSRCLEQFELGNDVHLSELSMGQKKKVYMSFALAANTPFLIMDEPSNGLDIPSKSQMRKVIASNMADDKTIVVSTHQVRDLDNLLDHVVMIERGELLLNQSYRSISEKLLFVEQQLGEPTDGAVFVQPSLYGNSVIMPNRFGEESTLNLEVLFNAMLAEPEKMREALKK